MQERLSTETTVVVRGAAARAEGRRKRAKECTVEASF